MTARDVQRETREAAERAMSGFTSVPALCFVCGERANLVMRLEKDCVAYPSNSPATYSVPLGYSMTVGVCPRHADTIEPAGEFEVLPRSPSTLYGTALTVLVCGGRDYTDYDAVAAHLDHLRDGYPYQLHIVNGGARGADSLARHWAMNQIRAGRRVLLSVIPADWDAYGKGAGPIRNQEMLSIHHVDIVLAFPGGAGTADMVRRARTAGVVVQEVK